MNQPYCYIPIGEVVESIADPGVVEALFKVGLASNSPNLAIPALHELIKRGESVRIARTLNSASERGQIPKNSSSRANGTYPGLRPGATPKAAKAAF